MNVIIHVADQAAARGPRPSVEEIVDGPQHIHTSQASVCCLMNLVGIEIDSQIGEQDQVEV